MAQGQPLQVLVSVELGGSILSRNDLSGGRTAEGGTRPVSPIAGFHVFPKLSVSVGKELLFCPEWRVGQPKDAETPFLPELVS